MKLAARLLLAGALAGSGSVAFAQDPSKDSPVTTREDDATVRQAVADPADPPKRRRVSFRHPADGWFDASEFLDTAYGFIPIIAPITEPAVGYGAVGGLMFGTNWLSAAPVRGSGMAAYWPRPAFGAPEGRASL